MRSVSTNKRKSLICGDNVDAIINYGHAAVFLNMEKMKEISASIDKNILADSVIAAKDASEALQNFARLLESKRKYLDGQLEVSAYTYISNFLLLRIGFRRRDSYTSLIKAIN